MRKQMLGSVIVALLLMAGCKPVATFGGEPRTKVFKAVISLSPSTTELMALTGVPMKGRTHACNYPPQVGLVDVVADLKPNYEKIAEKKPDLILVDRDLYSPTDLAKLKESGAEVKIIGKDNVKDYITELYQLGEVLSGESTINEYVIKVRKNVQASQGEPPARPLTAVMVIPDSSGHHMVAGSKSFQADIIRICGAKLLGPDSNKFESLNAEWLLAQNPDWIVVAGKANEFASDTRFSGLAAIKGLKFFGLDPDIALRKGMRVDKFIYSAHKAIMLGEENKK